MGLEWEEAVLKIPRTNSLLDSTCVEVVHELDEAGLRALLLHGGALDGADGFLGGFLLRGGQRVDVVEDVGGFGDVEGGAGGRVRWCGDRYIRGERGSKGGREVAYRISANM